MHRKNRVPRGLLGGLLLLGLIGLSEESGRFAQAQPDKQPETMVVPITQGQVIRLNMAKRKAIYGQFAVRQNEIASAVFPHHGESFIGLSPKLKGWQTCQLCNSQIRRSPPVHSASALCASAASASSLFWCAM